MVKKVSLKLALSSLVLAALTIGCGPDASGSLRLLLVNADREAHQTILVDPEFVEIEIMVEGDALGAPLRRSFFAGSRTASIPNLPVGKNYRVSVFGIAEGTDGRVTSHFFGRSGSFDMESGQNQTIPVQIGRSNCIGLNKSTVLNNQSGGGYDLVEARDGFATAPLPDGRILIIGGGAVDQTRVVAEPTKTIEIFDPVTYELRTSELQLNTPRAYHTATALLDGTILVFGGMSAVGGQVSTTAELIIPGDAPLVVPVDLTAGWSRYQHEAMRLDKDGSVLIVGGYDEAGNLTSSALRYFPQRGVFEEQGGLSSPRARGALAATELNGYPAAYSGGMTDGDLSRTVELFSTRTDQGSEDNDSPPCNDGGAASPTRGCFVNYKDLRVARSHHAMLGAYGGEELLIIGGYTNVPKTTVTDVIERFRVDPIKGTIVEDLGQLAFASGELAAHAVPDISGGRGGTASYLVVGGFTGMSLNSGAARLKESAKADNTPATYEIESLDRGCDLPEPRANLQIVDTGNQTLLLLGGHRYDGSWVATKRVEVYFPGFEATAF